MVGLAPSVSLGSLNAGKKFRYSIQVRSLLDDQEHMTQWDFFLPVLAIISPLLPASLLPCKDLSSDISQQRPKVFWGCWGVSFRNPMCIRKLCRP